MGALCHPGFESGPVVPHELHDIRQVLRRHFYAVFLSLGEIDRALELQ